MSSMTREKVIEGLEKSLAISKEVDSGFICITVGEAKKALELLKEQEANKATVRPVVYADSPKAYEAYHCERKITQNADDRC